MAVKSSFIYDAGCRFLEYFFPMLVFPHINIPSERWGWIRAKQRFLSIAWDNMYLTYLIANIARAILLFTWDKCFCHERCSSIEIPRNLIDDSTQLLPILFSGIPFISIYLYWFAKVQDLCLGLTTIYLVFFALRDNLLVQNHI